MPSATTMPASAATLPFAQPLHLALPSTSTSYSVTASPTALAAILDHHLRRPATGPSRVIGTLLGHRQPTTSTAATLHITDAFPVPHSEDGDQVALDMDFHRAMHEMLQKVDAKGSGIVGWYATGAGVMPFAGLVHEFYAKEAVGAGGLAPVHLVVDTEMGDARLGFQAFVAAPVGAAPRTDGDCVFLPVPVRVETKTVDLPALDVLTSARDDPHGLATIPSDLEALERALIRFHELLAAASEYVRSVASGEQTPNPVLGRALMDAVQRVPRLEEARFAREHNARLQDLLMVEYLEEVARAQLALSEAFQTLA